MAAGTVAAELRELRTEELVTKLRPHAATADAVGTETASPSKGR